MIAAPLFKPADRQTLIAELQASEQERMTVVQDKIEAAYALRQQAMEDGTAIPAPDLGDLPWPSDEIEVLIHDRWFEYSQPNFYYEVIEINSLDRRFSVIARLASILAQMSSNSPFVRNTGFAKSMVCFILCSPSWLFYGSSL